MIIIRTTCKNCGEVLLRSYDIQLHLRDKEDDSYFQFECPKCGKVGKGDADNKFIQILIANGVKPYSSDIPAEYTEPKSGSPITWDDILDFHIGLKNPNWIKELIV